MIRKEDNLLLGRIAKPHGTKGSVLIRLREIKPEEIKKREWLFVDIDGLLVPFFIEEFRSGTDDSLIIKLRQITSEQEARSISGSDVFISNDSIKRKKKRINDSASVNGYRVTDKNKGEVGVAVEITGVSSNPLLRIISGDKEWLVPAHEDIILEINDFSREIQINAPEGLFDL